MSVKKLMLKVLTKPSCTHCGSSIFILKRLQNRLNFGYKMVNISERRYRKYKIYAQEIPVVLDDNDEVLAKLKIVESEMYEILKERGVEEI